METAELMQNRDAVLQAVMQEVETMLDRRFTNETAASTGTASSLRFENEVKVPQIETVEKKASLNTFSQKTTLFLLFLLSLLISRVLLTVAEPFVKLGSSFTVRDENGRLSDALSQLQILTSSVKELEIKVAKFQKTAHPVRELDAKMIKLENVRDSLAKLELDVSAIYSRQSQDGNKLVKLEASVLNVRSQQTQHETRMGAIEAKYEDLGKRLEEKIEIRTPPSTENQKGLRDTVASLSERLDTIRSHVEGRIFELERGEIGNKSRRESTDEKLATQDKRLSTLDGRVSRIQKSLEERVYSVERDLRGTKTGLLSTDEVFKTHWGKISEIDGRVTKVVKSVESRLYEVESKQRGVQSALKSANGRIKSQDKQFPEIEKRLSTIQKNLEGRLYSVETGQRKIQSRFGSF